MWGWTEGGNATANKNGIDITDDSWIKNGAEVEVSLPAPPPLTWLKAAELDSCNHGSMILWEDLDGITWAKARWGDHAGLIPNLEFEIGRVYRKLIEDIDSNFIVYTTVIDTHFNVIEPVNPICSNDPLYLIKGQDVPKKTLDDGSTWPPESPLFDIGIQDELDIDLPMKDGSRKHVIVKWRCSEARRDTFSQLGRVQAGNLPHGKHAARNVGLSMLREGREINMSMALAVPSEARERWFGVEVDIPHELDIILGMTNNKQEYTRLERVLQHSFEEIIEKDETVDSCLRRIEKEDNDLAICLRIAWKTQEIWKMTKKAHLNMRIDHIKTTEGEDDSKADEGIDEPETIAEDTATTADPGDNKPQSPEEKELLQTGFKEELVNAGVPENEAEQIAARIVEKGLSYVIAYRDGMGSVFFNVRDLKGVKLIELNTDHSAYPYIKSSIEEFETIDVDDLRERLESSRLIIHLILEAWAKKEANSNLLPPEKKQLHRIREDWGRNLEMFIETYENSKS